MVSRLLAAISCRVTGDRLGSLARALPCKALGCALERGEGLGIPLDLGPGVSDISGISPPSAPRRCCCVSERPRVPSARRYNAAYPLKLVAESPSLIRPQYHRRICAPDSGSFQCHGTTVRSIPAADPSHKPPFHVIRSIELQQADDPLVGLVQSDLHQPVVAVPVAGEPADSTPMASAM